MNARRAAGGTQLDGGGVGGDDIGSAGPSDPSAARGLAGEPRMSAAELVQLPALRWPADVAVLTGVPPSTLLAFRRDGDAPRLYRLGRAAFTTAADVREWILAHQVADERGGGPASRSRGVARSRR